MHIPKDEIKNIIPFSKEISLSLCEQHEYDSEKWLYIPHEYREYRYILGTKGKKPLICIGINPSTAEPDNLDNTLKSVERIAIGNGFDSFIMFNVYPQRATRPNDMSLSVNKDLHRENMNAFAYILSLSSVKPTVWAAWGTIIETRPYLLDCLIDMIRIGKEYGANWVKCGPLSKNGHPHHPLYLKNDSLLELFDIEEYHKTIEHRIYEKEEK